MNIALIVLYTAAGLYALAQGRGAEAVFQGGPRAVELTMTLVGSMTMWSGMMEILKATGDVQRLGRLLRKLLRPLFPGVTEGDTWAAMGANLAANFLGLGNAATPAGVQAAGLLAAQGETGLQGLAMLLVMNNGGLQLLPTTVMTLRSAAGSANPAAVWLPTLISSLTATVCGCGLMAFINRRRLRHG